MVWCDLGLGWHLVMTLTTQDFALNTLLLYVLLVCAASLAIVGKVCLRLQRQHELSFAKLATPLLEHTYDDTERQKDQAHEHTSQKDQAHEQSTRPNVLE